MKKIILCASFLSFGLMSAVQAAAPSTYLQVEGPVQAVSTQAKGTWKIGGISFLVNEQTLIDQGKCALKAGSHAEVNAYAQGNQWVATEIDCERTPKAQVKVELKGVITAKGAATGGVWKIGNQSFQVNGQTRLDQKECPLNVNAYAEMDGYYQGNKMVATKLECERNP